MCDVSLIFFKYSELTEFQDAFAVVMLQIVLVCVVQSLHLQFAHLKHTYNK